jgi:selenocysteine-specific elongation factor
MSSEDFTGKIPINVGLLGHVDSGKTAIARCLTEIVSTAGLDAHPQSQKRGITIDLGFSFFTLGDYIVTLVDAPGHADLIRSVVSSANIIDAAILVIDGTQGPQIQTGEHLVILESFGIQDIFIAINKVDVLSPEELQSMKDKVKQIVSNTTYAKDAPILAVSAKTGEGIDDLKATLLEHFRVPTRDIDAPFRVVVDHHFPVKGHGTVLTGTILSGKLTVGDSFAIEPINIIGKVKSLQFAKTDVAFVEAGQRVGIAVSNIDPSRLYRGCVLVKDKGEIQVSQMLKVTCQINSFFTGSLSFGMQVHVSAGMLTASGQIFPFENRENLPFKCEEESGTTPFDAVIALQEPIVASLGDKILLSRLDLPPTTLRIVGIGIIDAFLEEKPALYRYKIKTGQVKSVEHAQGIVVENLAQSKEGAEKLVNHTTINPPGRITGTFGTKGNVTVKLDPAAPPVDVGQEVQAGEPRKIKY